MSQTVSTTNDIKLDDRMSDETRAYLTSYLQMTKPTDLLRLDLNMVRRVREMQVAKQNETLRFDSLDIVQFTVRNPADNYDIPVRKYRPLDVDEASAPIVVFFHGGGYCLGSSLTHHHSVALLADQTKCVWLSVDNRLCPEHRFPVPLDDCRAVVDATLATASAANVQVGVAGDSSGGQIAAILAHEFKERLSFQLLVYPCVKFGGVYDSYRQFQDECYLLVPDVLRFFVQSLSDKPEQFSELLSPIDRSDFAGLAPCLLVAVELDPMVDESKHYYAKLRQSNVDADLVVIDGTVHGYFSLPYVYRDAFKQTVDAICAFMNKIQKK